MSYCHSAITDLLPSSQHRCACLINDPARIRLVHKSAISNSFTWSTFYNSICAIAYSNQLLIYCISNLQTKIADETDSQTRWEQTKLAAKWTVRFILFHDTLRICMIDTNWYFCEFKSMQFKKRWINKKRYHYWNRPWARIFYAKMKLKHTRRFYFMDCQARGINSFSISSPIRIKLTFASLSTFSLSMKHRPTCQQIGRTSSAWLHSHKLSNF